MPLIVTVLMVTLVTQCWSARMNWTPQAILYLKGAQGHRSGLERTSRQDDDPSHSVTRNQHSDGQRLSLASSILLELLQQAAEADEGNPETYLDDQEVYLNYL
ncbi:spexin-like [Anabas testudineus]|uniref:spexin-like n=1 Tax=Anabas testudineus TaxID=64144 RepID=UPI000E4611BC|nr:spexin-like [Anabas testudineus]